MGYLFAAAYIIFGIVVVRNLINSPSIMDDPEERKRRISGY